MFSSSFLRRGRALAPVSGAAFSLLLLSSSLRAQTSQLWGKDGALWTPQSRLPDFSHAGYHAGEAPIPDVPVVGNVKDFGAVGDGSTDDTAAFKAAIAGSAGGALLIPAGRYLITDVLSISKPDLVLRGEGSGPTGSVLYITKSLADLYGPAPQWSWSGGFLRFAPPAGGGPLTAISAEAARGDDKIQVASAAGLSAGQLIDLRVLDDGSGTLGQELHDGQAASGTCAYQVPLRLDWPVRIAAVEGTTVTLAQPLRIRLLSAWKPEIRSLPALTEVGVEHLRIEFIPKPYAGHLMEPGYNPIFFTSGVADGWVRDLTVVDADNGIITDQLIKNLTFRDIHLQGRPGHHGYNLAESADLLIEDFTIDNVLVHAMTLDHRANGVVFSRGKGSVLLPLDHHRDSPFENLFTEISSEYDFFSGGNECAGPHAGARNTYWNLWSPMTVPLLWGAIQSNAVGQLAVSDKFTLDQQWYENIAVPDPQNLYHGQLSARLCSKDSYDACHEGAWDLATATCSKVPRPDGIACDDGDPCTGEDACKAGVCGGKPLCGGAGGAGGATGSGTGGASSAGAGGAAGGSSTSAGAGGAGGDAGGCGCALPGASGPDAGSLGALLALLGLLGGRARQKGRTAAAIRAKMPARWRASPPPSRACSTSPTGSGGSAPSS